MSFEDGDAKNVDFPGEQLPGPGEESLFRRASQAASIVAALALLLAHAIKIVGFPVFEWWLLVVAMVGVIAADFASGLVHWVADTWGRETLPVIGPWLLRPFRVHHVNPDAFLRGRFTGVNGDVAILVAAVLLLVLVLPVETAFGRAAEVSVFVFCLVGLPTNQIHQWANNPNSPQVVKWLQGSGFILGRQAHARHHVSPFVDSYCITTGWCNGPLSAVGFFPWVERWVTLVTGLTPREDDNAFRSNLAKPSGKKQHG